MTAAMPRHGSGGAAAALARAACAAARALRGRALLRGEAQARLAAAGAGSDAALQLAALLGRLRLGGAVAAGRCRRCGSGEAQLLRTACGACGSSRCASCQACLALGRSRECGLLVLGMPAQAGRGGAGLAPPEQLPPAAERLRRWGLSPAQSAAAASALAFLERPLQPPPARGLRPRLAALVRAALPSAGLLRLPPLHRGATAAAGRLFRRTRRHKPAEPHPSFLLWAVTGAGKTEMIFPLLESVLSRGGRALVATPRRDVVLELEPRLRRAFPDTPPVALYGGSPQRGEDGRLTLATTHQLLRFRESFDLIVLDELDAFPFAGDAMLHEAVARSGAAGSRTVLLTATPPPSLQRLARLGRLPHAKVPVRYHRHPLPVPRLLRTPPALGMAAAGRMPSSLRQAMARSLDRGAQLFVFVPAIRSAEPVARLIRKLFPDRGEVAATHSQDPERADKVVRFRQKQLRMLVTTTILERGVTIPGSDVFILDADSRIFDEASLVQSAGRAGRSAADPQGFVWFAAASPSASQKRAIRQIRLMNRAARKAGYLLSGSASSRRFHSTF
ncbi:helicase-related protein [Paenibacillus sp. B01]|uniref:helicase-related protein n=1 Tax=Paenibacillus sp. B01 TaxID=2660554 RepID=UPI00129A2F74|nr:helicase-related protein [Paenibacillus sp. B01]QGG58106.1 DNA/RNA helicase [Paenibacillus sp. B01]